MPLQLNLYCGGGQGDGSPGVMGAGGLREAGEEGAGGEISKRGRSREKWEKFRNTGTIFRNRKGMQRREPLWKGAGTGSAGCGRRDVQTPVPPTLLADTSHRQTPLLSRNLIEINLPSVD